MSPGDGGSNGGSEEQEKKGTIPADDELEMTRKKLAQETQAREEAERRLAESEKAKMSEDERKAAEDKLNYTSFR